MRSLWEAGFKNQKQMKPGKQGPKLPHQISQGEEGSNIGHVNERYVYKLGIFPENLSLLFPSPLPNNSQNLLRRIKSTIHTPQTTCVPCVPCINCLSDMPSIIYRNLPGPVGDCLKPSSLATTATVPLSPTTSLVYTTSHLGLDLVTGQLVKNSIEAELEAVFSCLDAALKDAGVSSGLFQAFKLVSYLVDPAHESIMQGIFQRLFPGHTPTWTMVIVKEINVPGMSAEISAEAALFHV